VTPRYAILADGSMRSRGRTPLNLPPVVVPPTPPKYPALPDLPAYRLVDLYQPGDSFMDVVKRMPSRRHLVLPDGYEGELDGFAEGNNTIAAYHPNLRGIYGPGMSKASLTLKRKSSTAVQRQQITPQSSGGTTQLTLLRIGAFQGTDAERQCVLYGFTLNGTDQEVMAESENQPHRYQGINVYGGVDSVVQNVKVTGVPGHWNSPPGETFQIQGFRDRRTRVYDVEVDGFNIDGRRVGSSPFGGNNTVGSEVVDLYGHDGYVSGLTYSFSGSETNPDAASKDIITRRVRMRANANHTLTGGKRFTGVNHENALGYVRHYESEIQMVNMTEWNVGHMAFNNALFDNPDIQIIEPTWFESPPRNAGCFTITVQKTYAGVTQKQTTMPKVIKNGRELEPFHITAPPGSVLPINPATHYVVCHP
jgi:hypothetical protein